ncbi:hypothetical protein CCACVL1_05603 [Corchorus capsularis]|uniref:Homeobox-leucine zipper protein n=1 Tax=Corchorus capsularis TaxID=210143 RepID=A0A1R3JJN8_COCAP|nr:hypothetical protein CCACVL1_05603 [Corchorus capsularis]
MERGCVPGTEEAIIIAEELEATQNQRKKKNYKMKNKRRFSDEQIRLLESIFESETKLEPRKKLQLARELGLQPRQVAIWFQNRRARWKSKQIEQDYRTLRDNYDNLASKFESLKNEKQALMLQLQNLSELLAEPHEINDKGGKGVDGSSNGGGSEAEAEAEPPPKPSFQQEGLMEDRGFLGLQENDRKKIEHAGKQPAEEDYMGNESPASPEKLYGFDSAAFRQGRSYLFGYIIEYFVDKHSWEINGLASSEE